MLVPQVDELEVFNRPMPLDHQLSVPGVSREPGLTVESQRLEKQMRANGLAEQRWRAGSTQCLANLNSWPSRLSLVEWKTLSPKIVPIEVDNITTNPRRQSLVMTRFSFICSQSPKNRLNVPNRQNCFNPLMMILRKSASTKDWKYKLALFVSSLDYPRREGIASQMHSIHYI